MGLKKEERQVIFGKKIREGCDYYEAIEKVKDIPNVERLIKRYEKSNQYLLKENEILSCPKGQSI